MENKKRITSVDKAKSNFYLKAGYGLGAEALTGDRAHKIASESSVQMGLQAKLPFTHDTYNTAGDIFDAVTQEKMALDLASYTEAMQNNKVAYGSPKNNKNEIFGNKEVVSDATPLTFEPLPSMQVSEEQISSYVETLETEKSKVGVNDQHYDANDVPKMSLVPEKEINTGNADYDAQPQFLYPEHKDGLKYQELGHGAGYVEPINPEKDAASEVFMNTYNDNQVYQPNFDEALAREITSTTTEDIKETVTKAEEINDRRTTKQALLQIVNQQAEVQQRLAQVSCYEKIRSIRRQYAVCARQRKRHIRNR